MVRVNIKMKGFGNEKIWLTEITRTIKEMRDEWCKKAFMKLSQSASEFKGDMYIKTLDRGEISSGAICYGRRGLDKVAYIVREFGRRYSIIPQVIHPLYISAGKLGRYKRSTMPTKTGKTIYPTQRGTGTYDFLKGKIFFVRTRTTYMGGMVARPIFWRTGIETMNEVLKLGTEKINNKIKNLGVK